MSVKAKEIFWRGTAVAILGAGSVGCGVREKSPEEAVLWLLGMQEKN